MIFPRFSKTSRFWCVLTALMYVGLSADMAAAQAGKEDYYPEVDEFTTVDVVNVGSPPEPRPGKPCSRPGPRPSRGPGAEIPAG